VLIRLDNIRSGGGLQVAQSFLTELAGFIDDEGSSAYPWLHSGLRILVSDEVARNCSPDALAQVPVSVAPHRSVRRSLTDPLRAGVVFTLFGPTYDRVVARKTIAGFADVTSLYPELAEGVTRTARQRAKLRVRRLLSRSFFRNTDQIIVEAPHLAEDLSTTWGIPEARTSIVPNVVNGIFAGAVRRTRQQANETPTFCYVTRAYPHKNLTFLGRIAKALRTEFDTDVRFLLTLTDDEWSALDPQVRASSINVGPVSVSELPGIYARSDGCVFPSLLEGFSATPLEALATGTPLIASDRRFCTEALGDTALYADPNDANAWAVAIHSVLTDQSATADRVERGLALIRTWRTPRDRAIAYVAEIDRQLQDVAAEMSAR
jgi:glycosyltransferase involved in cell wall biosynthesis